MKGPDTASKFGSCASTCHSTSALLPSLVFCSLEAESLGCSMSSQSCLLRCAIAHPEDLGSRCASQMYPCPARCALCNVWDLGTTCTDTFMHCRDVPTALCLQLKLLLICLPISLLVVCTSAIGYTCCHCSNEKFCFGQSF